MYWCESCERQTKFSWRHAGVHSQNICENPICWRLCCERCGNYQDEEVLVKMPNSAVYNPEDHDDDDLEYREEYEEYVR